MALTPDQQFMIGTGASILGQGMSAYSTGQQNKKSRKFTEHMYGVQRRDSLADWALQNEYNSPREQMKRLRDAGLNPNLVYGNGSATMPSASVRSSDAPSPQFEAARYSGDGVQSSMAAYFNSKVQEATTDNLTAQNTNLLKESELKDAQIANTQASTAATLQNTTGAQFDLSQKERLKDISAQALEASLNKTLADTDYTTAQNRRSGDLHQGNLQQQVEAILTSRLQRARTDAEIRHINQVTENLRKSGLILDEDVRLRQKNISPSDPAIFRRAQEIIDKAFKTPQATWDNMKTMPDRFRKSNFAKKHKNFLRPF